MELDFGKGPMFHTWLDLPESWNVSNEDEDKFIRFEIDDMEGYYAGETLPDGKRFDCWVAYEDDIGGDIVLANFHADSFEEAKRMLEACADALYE